MADDDEEVPEPKRKVFIQAVSGYVGGNLAKRFATEGFEVLGTLKSPADPKPLAVTTVVEPSEEGLRNAFLECELTVLDCLGDVEAAEKMLSAIALAEPIETPKVLVGVSSIMTWARTSPNSDEPEAALTDAEYKRRRPHSSYKELVALEKLVTKSKREGLRTHVVAAGLTYGAEEDLFHPLFKAAWSCQPLPLLAIGDGSNVLPTVHIYDLCSVVVKLLDGDSSPYLLAVDTPPEDAEEPQTLANVVKALSKELGVGEVLPPPPRDQVLLERDYEFFQIGAPIGDAPGLKLKAAAIDELGIEWHAQSGLLAAIPTVVQEFRESRRLQPLRLLVHGNDPIAMTELASALAAEYKLPHIQASAVIADAASQEGGPPADEQAVGAALSSTECRNKGYILQGFPETHAQATALFGAIKPAAAEGEEPAEAEGEEGEGAPKGLAAAPEFVIIAEATEAVIQAKLLAQAEPALTKEQLAEKLAAYAENNADDSPTSMLASLPEVEALGPLAVVKDTSVETLLTKARVYLGQPRNYGPSDAEIAAKKELEEAEAAKAAAEEARIVAEREAAEAAERKRRDEHEARRAAEVQQQEQELLEVRSIPLRNYLMQNVIPTLTEGLIEVCKQKPEDPVDYLAEYLFQKNPVEDEHFE